MSKVAGDVRHAVGAARCAFAGRLVRLRSPDAGLLVSLLPSLVHVRGIERLSTLVRFVDEETSESKPGRDRSRHVGHARRRYARAVVANRLFV
jgi:hypothetical protein